MSLSILNVGEGDTKLTFDSDKPEELERTRRIVTDMLAMGYAILVRDGESWKRATGFDPKTCEYLIADIPPTVDAIVVPAPRQKRSYRRRVPAASTKAVGVARSAGGMSAAADSVEIQNIERFDPCADVRNRLRALARVAGEWAGIPLPLEGEDLIVEPKYRAAAALTSKSAHPDTRPPEEQERIRNQFYCAQKRANVIVWNEPDGRIEWGLEFHVNHFDIDLQTMGVSAAWGIEQEANAVQTLAELLPHHAFKKYMLTGMFVERSKRSGVYYFFRRLKPTIAASAATGSMKILAALCMHPIAYYRNTWSGAMCPTDDVIAHLMLMRGDERLYWRRCNQHPAWRREAGL